MGERRVPWVSGRAGPDAPSRLRAWRTPRSDRRRPAVGRVARGCAPHDWRLGRPAGRCNREWEVPLGACKLPVGFPVGPRQVPLGARVGLSKRASKSEWEHGGSASVVPLGPSAFGEAPSPSPTRRREAHPACSHWEAAPLPCARHFLWGTFLVRSFVPVILVTLELRDTLEARNRCALPSSRPSLGLRMWWCRKVPAVRSI